MKRYGILVDYAQKIISEEQPHERAAAYTDRRKRLDRIQDRMLRLSVLREDIERKGRYRVFRVRDVYRCFGRRPDTPARFVERAYTWVFRVGLRSRRGQPFWKSTLPQCIKRMGDHYKVPYVFYPGQEDRKGFTAGDKKSVTFTYSDSIVRDAVSRITADLGGTSAGFEVEPGDVKVDVTGDGKVRLGFYVRMKAGKKDYGDIGLRSGLNDVRKTIAFKYGLDADVVDVRSTIEYV